MTTPAWSQQEVKPATPPAPASGSAPSPAATAPASMDASACTNSSKPEPTQAKFANAPGFVVPAPSFSYTVLSNIGPASAWTTSLRPFSLSTGIPGTPGLPGPPGLTPPASVSSHPVIPCHTSDPSTSSLRPNIVVGPVATNPGVQPQVYSAYPSMPPMAANPQALWLQPPQMSGMAPPPFVAYLAVLSGPFPFPAHGMPISSMPSPDPQPPGVTPEGSAGGMSSSSVPGWLVAGNSATQTEVQPLADDTSKHVSGRNEAAANEQLDAWTAHKADSGVLDNVASKAAPISIANISEGGQSCAYSSEGDGRNASDNKQEPPKDGCSVDSGKSTVKQTATDVGTGRDSHARLGEQDLKEWLHIAKLAIERKKKDPSLLSRHEKFKNEFLRRIIPWEEISVSWETFPYYINEHTKNSLVECVASHLKHKKINSSRGARLNSSSGRILLQSIPGTELFRERLVSALARDLQVPLLVLDSSVLAPYDFGEDCSSAEDGACETETEDESEATSDGSDDEVDVPATAEAALKKIVPFDLEDFAKMSVKSVIAAPPAEPTKAAWISCVGRIHLYGPHALGLKRVSGDSKSSSEPSKPEDVANSEQPKHQLRRGDHVKYIGPSGKISADNRPLSTGQRGVVYEVNLDRVAVFLDANNNKASGDAADETSTEQSTPPVYWISVDDIEPDLDSHAEDCYIALEALCEVLRSQERRVVYFPDLSQWLSRAVTKANRSKIVNKVHEMFGQLPGPVVLVCGQNIVETGWKEREKFTMILPNIGRLAKLNNLTQGLKANHKSDVDSIHKLCNNILRVYPPEEEHLRKTFDKQVEEDRKIIISRSNINELNQVLEKHELSCVDHLHVNTEGVILTGWKAEKVIGWAKNHYLSSCVHPAIKGDRLSLPRESLEVAIARLKEQEAVSQETSLNFANLAKDCYERNFVSAVVPPGEVGVRFDDVGALEDVKDALNELVILPMRRPELFSHGNLLRPCKGMLLFGPPGTGKTLLAKALATEAGANFISITGSTMTSKWYGDSEKLTKALFSFASRLAPVVIFVDEVDSLLGARGGSCEHEATRRMRNEFLAAWDGLRSNDKERILILGATNRPFDLDDAVIRRLPRRLYVDLPDAENRKKILKIILGQENLEHGFEINKLASMTEGYSGSDLKNLCIAAAYRPVQELLEEEKKGSKNSSPTPRPLHLDDFLQSKSKVAPSVASDSASINKLRKWNEQYGEGGSRRK